jgi:large subunit ribosomal protein L4e
MPEHDHKKPKKKEAHAARKGVMIPVMSIEGKPSEHEVPMPEWFSEVRFRPDVIKRAVVAIQANRRQKYGTDPMAGMKHSVDWSGKGQGVSRTPRLRGGMTGAQAPNTVGGRRAHPPKAERDFTLKINRKELKLAKLSAMRAVADPNIVHARGHKFSEHTFIPIVVDDKIEEVKKAKDLIPILKSLGVYADIIRADKGTHVRAGRGKSRGRRHRTPNSILFLVKASEGLSGAKNLAGASVKPVALVNVEDLAPGGHPGRLVIFSKSAFEEVASWSTK